MPETKDLVPVAKGGRLTWAQEKELAAWAHQSKQFKNIKSPQQAFLLIQYGKEMGMGPGESLQSVYEVNGTPSLKANTIGKMLKEYRCHVTGKCRFDYHVIERSAKRCEIEFFERNQDTGKMESRGKIEYTMDDAKLCKDYDRNPQYKTRPKNMLFARCLTEGARVFAPNCLGGITPYTPDELGAQVDDNGEPVEQTGAVQDAEWEEKVPAEVVAEEYETLRSLCNEKNKSLSNLLHGVGGDPSDCQSMTRSQYDAIMRILKEI